MQSELFRLLMEFMQWCDANPISIGDSIEQKRPTEAKNFGIVTGIREFEIPDGARRGLIATLPAPAQGNVPQAAAH